MKERLVFRAAFLAVVLLSLPLAAKAAVPTEAKLMRGRLGLGFTNQIATGVDRTLPALSTKYYFSQGTAASLNAGFDTRQNDNSLAIGLKLYKNVFFESNLLFYLGAGGAYVNRAGSNFQVSAFLGSEFFFDRLPSLGLSFEFGIRGDSTSGTFALRTIGDSFLTAGMHFYL